MADNNFTPHRRAKGKPRKATPAPSNKTRWAYWMQAIEPTAPEIDAAFPGYHPLWVQSSQRLTIAPENFRHLRRHCLNITQTQAAAYLRVKATEVRAWERGEKPIPFMAFELLRLVFESVAFRLSHAAWDGWYIDHDGHFVSPDMGKLAVTPAEVSFLPMLRNHRDILQAEVGRLKAELEAQQAENTRLRTLYQTNGIVRELAGMHERLAALMESIQTAQVIPFPLQPDRKEAVA